MAVTARRRVVTCGSNAAHVVSERDAAVFCSWSGGGGEWFGAVDQSIAGLQTLVQVDVLRQRSEIRARDRRAERVDEEGSRQGDRVDEEGDGLEEADERAVWSTEISSSQRTNCLVRFCCVQENRLRQRSNSRVALLRQPNRARSLLGAARAAAQTGNQAAALTAYTTLLEQWKQADDGLLELREARDYLKQAKR